MDNWYMYLVRCADGTLYCGVTTSIPRRIAMHNSGRGAVYTANRTPVTLVYSEVCWSRGRALGRELQVKRMSRARKEGLIRKGSRPTQVSTPV
jgi:putative endonuclease